MNASSSHVREIGNLKCNHECKGTLMIVTLCFIVRYYFYTIVQYNIITS
jgi:hypothetical protein